MLIMFKNDDFPFPPPDKSSGKNTVPLDGVEFPSCFAPDRFVTDSDSPSGENDFECPPPPLIDEDGVDACDDRHSLGDLSSKKSLVSSVLPTDLDSPSGENDFECPPPPLIFLDEDGMDACDDRHSLGDLSSKKSLVSSVLSNTLYGSIDSDISEDSDDFSDMTDSSDVDITGALVAELSDRMIKKIGSLSLQIVSFAKSKDKGPLQVLAFIDTLLHYLEVNKAVYGFCYQQFKNLMRISTSSSSTVEPQSFSEAATADIIKYVTNNLDTIVKKLVGYISAIVIAPSCLGSSDAFTRMVGVALKSYKFTAINCTAAVVDSIATGLCCVAQYIVSCSFPNSVSALIRRSVEVRDDFVRKKDIFDEFIKADFDIMCLRLKGELSMAHSKYMGEEKMTLANAIFTELKLLTDLHTRILSISVKCKSGPRPISLLIIGEPAIGKSEATNTIVDMIGMLFNGCPYTQAQLAPMVRSKFFDTVTNETKVLLLDDVGATSKVGETSEAITENYCRLLIDVVNNVTFRANKAVAEDKGKVSIECQAVIATCNWANRHTDIQSAETPSAALRRHDRVVMTLRDEYKDAKGMIDLQKIKNEGGNLYFINPWSISYYRYNFLKARKVTMASGPAAREVIHEELWEPIKFTRGDTLVESLDMTTSDLYMLLGEQINSGKRDSAAVDVIRKATANHLFGIVEPQSLVVSACKNCFIGIIVFNVLLTVFTWTSALLCDFWIPFKAVRSRLGVASISAHRTYDSNGRYILIAEEYEGLISKSSNFTRALQTVWCVNVWIFIEFVAAIFRWFSCKCSKATFCGTMLTTLGFWFTLHIQVWVHYFMVGIVASNPSVSRWCKYFGLTGAVLQHVSKNMLVITDQPIRVNSVSERAMVVSQTRRGSYLHGLLSLAADREKQLRYGKVIVGGILSGLTLGMVVRFTKYIMSATALASLVTPESTLSTDGIITAVSDIKIETPTKKVVYKGRADYQLPGGNKTAVSTMTAGQCQNIVVNNMVRIRITPSDSGTVKDMTPCDTFTMAFGIPYITNARGVAVLTVAHLFQVPSKYYLVELFLNDAQHVDPFIITAEHISFLNDVDGLDIKGDLCMFMGRGTGDMKNLDKLFNDAPRTVGDACVRIVPNQLSDIYSHRDSVTLVPTVYTGTKKYNYDVGTGASGMFQGPIGCYFDGQGGAGLCGTIIMGGGVPIAMHVGEDRGIQKIIGVPLCKSWIDAMYHNLAIGIGGRYSALPTMMPMIISEPHLDSVEYTTLTVTPNVYVRPDSAIDRARVKAQHSLIGTLLRDDEPIGVKNRTNHKRSPHLSSVVKHLSICDGISQTFCPPTEDMYHTYDTMIDNSSKVRPTEFYTARAAKDSISSMLSDAVTIALDTHEPYRLLAPRNLHAALQGIGVNLAGKLAINTSMGPLGGGTKNLHIGTGFNPLTSEMDLGFREDSPIGMDVIRQYYEIIVRRSKGEVGLTINSVCPKDEVLPVKGLTIDGKPFTKPTRSINVMDVAHTLVMRSYFQPIMLLLGYDSFACGHAVGMDPTISNTALLKRLIGSDNISGLDKVNFIAMDFSKFDLNLSSDLMSSVMDILINLTLLLPGYTNNDRQVMGSIAYDLVNPTMVIGGTLVRFTGTNTSGNPLTTMINCIANLIINCQIRLMCLADIKSGIGNGPGPRDYSMVTVDDCTFVKNTRFTTYGDDNILCNPVGDPVDQLVTIEYGARLGLVITGSDKSVEATKHARDFGFLKRNFVVYSDPDNGRIVVVLAPLELTSIFKPFVWGTFKEDLIDHYAGLIKGAIGELVQHGQVVYDEYVASLRSLILDINESRRPRKNGPEIVRNLSGMFDDSHFPTWHDAMINKYGDLLSDGGGGFIDPTTLLVTRV